jgi:nucleotide-binding universal stress UspA family protein
MKILIPIDFSPSTESAVKYAAGLATSLDGSIHLVHVIEPFVKSQSFLTVTREEVERNTVLTIHSIQESLKNEYGLSSNIDVCIGVVADEILKVARERKADMIVMGTHGATRFRRLLFGSNTASVIEKSPIPVFAIPEGIQFTTPKRIVFGTDFNASDIHELKELSVFAAWFDAEIYAVHVVNRFEEYEDDFDIAVSRCFTDAVNHKIPYEHIRCEEYQHTDVAEGIRCFIQEEGVDILALSVRHKTMLQKLFTKSLTREFVFDTGIPLLVFHAQHPEMDDESDS